MFANAPAEPASESAASPVKWKSPALLMLPPFSNEMVPLPLAVIVPPAAVVSVRLLRLLPAPVEIVSVADGLTVVVPPPCIGPPLQSATFVSVTVPVPSSVPPERLNCGMATLPVTLSVPPETVTRPAPLTVVPAAKV